MSLFRKKKSDAGQRAVPEKKAESPFPAEPPPPPLAGDGVTDDSEALQERIERSAKMSVVACHCCGTLGVKGSRCAVDGCEV